MQRKTLFFNPPNFFETFLSKNDNYFLNKGNYLSFFDQNVIITDCLTAYLYKKYEFIFFCYTESRKTTNEIERFK